MAVVSRRIDHHISRDGTPCRPQDFDFINFPLAVAAKI